MSSSHPDDGFGSSTICGADQWIPSVLSEMAMDCFGRHESHMRNLSCRRSTQISKQVPYWPPSTGFPAYLCQPPEASSLLEAARREKEDSIPAIEINVTNSLLFISSVCFRSALQIACFSFQFAGRNPA